MTTIHERLAALEEKGVIRRVRTPAGVRRFKQPLGSIIFRKIRLPGAKWPKRDQENVSAARTKLPADAPLEMEQPDADYGIARIKMTYKGVSIQGHQFSKNGEYVFEAHDHARDRRTRITGVADGKVTEKEIKERIERDVKVPMAPKSHKPAFLEQYEGIYGRDWTWGEDYEAETPDWDENDRDAREQWVLNEMEALEFDIFDEAMPDGTVREVNIRAKEIIAASHRFHEDRWPGFGYLLNTYSMDTAVSQTVGRAIAYNVIIRPEMVRMFPEGGMMNNFSETGRLFDRLREMGAIKEEQDWAYTAIALNYQYYGGDARNIWESGLPGQSQGGHWSYNFQNLADEGFTKEEIGYLGTITHETGHTVGRMLWGDARFGKDAPEGTQEKYRAMFHEFQDELRDLMQELGLADSGELLRLDSNKIQQHVSRYGTSDLHEFFAEVWTSYHLDRTPTLAVYEVGQLMEEYFDRFMDLFMGEEE